MVSLRSDFSYEAFYKNPDEIARRKEKKNGTDDRKKNDEKTSLTATREIRLFTMKRKKRVLSKNVRNIIEPTQFTF